MLAAPAGDDVDTTRKRTTQDRINTATRVDDDEAVLPKLAVVLVVKEFETQNKGCSMNRRRGRYGN
jgi:hypothetical protein